MMDLVSISTGLFTSVAYDLLKNGGAMTVPHLRNKLKDWVFSDETANHIVELSSNVPANKRVDANALEDYIQSSGLWQSQLSEIKQKNIQNKQEVNVKGDVGTQTNIQKVENSTINIGTTEAPPVKKS